MHHQLLKNDIKTINILHGYENDILYKVFKNLSEEKKRSLVYKGKRYFTCAAASGILFLSQYMRPTILQLNYFKFNVRKTL